MINNGNSYLTVLALGSALAAVASSTSIVTPCVYGSGAQNGCGGCNNASAMTLTPIAQSTTVNGFQLDGADESQTGGGGLDVWWSIPQPDPGCKIVMTQPFTPTAHEDGVTGNTILSAERSGCFYGHVNSHGFNIGYCCGNGDCTKTGAGIMKRNLPIKSGRYAGLKNKRRASRTLTPTVKEDAEASLTPRDKSYGVPPPDPAPSPSDPGYKCSAATDPSPEFQKAGTQQVVASELNCDQGQFCSQTKTGQVTVSNSVENTHEVQMTDTHGSTFQVQAGFQFMTGPTGSVTAGVDDSYARAVTDSLAQTRENSFTNMTEQTAQQKSGTVGNLWFTPTLNCVNATVTCNNVPITVQNCTQVMSNGMPIGEAGMMTVG